MIGERSDHFYDRVYLPSSRHLFTDSLADAEAALILRLFGLDPSAALLDLGCGDGRHLRALARAGHTGAVGLDRSAPLLEASREAARRDGTEVEVVQGDYRKLPFEPERFDGAYVWYAALFVLGSDAEHLEVLRGIHRVLRPGARLIHDGANPDLLAREPQATFETRLPSGVFVSERCEWREQEGREHGFRRLLYPDGRVEEGAWATRHYRPQALGRLLASAGFEVESLLDEAGAPFEPQTAHDLVVVARKPENEAPQ